MRIAPSLVACVLLALLGGTACSEDAPERKKKPVKENRLGKERSPYLRQHRHNPVDWFPWGPEAFAKAKAEDKPIFLSVGYAACHWCHVMEHESFEDEETARFLNETFICVKVDREERPDIDGVYMGFVQRRTGRGGWPMTVLLTPGRKPFWGATYLRSADLQQLCTRVKQLWKEQRNDLQRTADAYAEQARDLAQGGEGPETDDSDVKILETMKNAQTLRFDRKNGGFGGAPKFPPHADLLFFLDAGGSRMGEEQRTQIFTTLDALDRGGIHDQVGGGFHRYSTDAHWLLPHFEKMLYDNALLAQAYAMAFGLTKAPHYRRVVERLFVWLERELKRPGGGYASSLDADTEGEEGLTYTWTWKELAAVLSKEELTFVAPLLGLRAEGNFNDEATHAPSGRNIPHWPKEPTAIPRVDALLEKLHAVRVGRAQPGLDDKVIVGWNGLLLSAFARAGHSLAAPAYLDRGRALATFLLERCRRSDGVLLRFPKGSGAEIVGFCEDHVHVVEGLLDLADATGEARWADAARDLGRQMNTLFLDPQGGGFFATSTTHHEVLIAREKESWDSPIPSDNGTAARANLRLFARTQDRAFLEAADGTLSAYRSTMADPRQAFGVMALIRAMADRMEGMAGEAPLQGDLHLRRGVLQVDVFLERTQVQPGEDVGLVVRLLLEKGWHINAHTPASKDLIATRLVAAPGAAVALKQAVYPKAAVRSLAGTDVALYEGTVEIRATLAVPADAAPGRRAITLVLGYQPCDASSCQAPVEVTLSLALQIDAEETGARRYPSVFK